MPRTTRRASRTRILRAYRPGFASPSGACDRGGATKRIFATSLTFTGNLGGLTGADAKCATAAAAGNIPGTFKAWLSSSFDARKGAVGADCNGWTSASTTFTGSYGDGRGLTVQWTAYGDTDCSQQLRLIC